jgi:hypothetical protein
LAANGYDRLWPVIPEGPDDGRQRWSQVVVLQALDRAGLLANGAQVVLVAAPSPALAGALAAAGCACATLDTFEELETLGRMSQTSWCVLPLLPMMMPRSMP